MSALTKTVAPDAAAAWRREVLVARQPIFDRALEVHGYELLHRTAGRTEARFDDPDTATAEVICAGFTDIGLGALVEERIAHINLSRDLLVSRDPMALPPGRVALELPGDTAPDAEVLDALDDYHAEGFCIVLDGARVTRESLPLLRRARALKLDVASLGLEETVRQVELAAPLGRELIAYRVESEEAYKTLEALGVRYFQGFFFARPRIVAGTRLTSSKVMTLRLLAALHDPDSQVEQVAALVGQEVALSYKLLRFLNSSSFSLPGKVDSIQRAVAYLGLAATRRWAGVMVLSSVDDRPSELTRTLLVRARLCEGLCAAARIDDAGAAFTVGLFSGLDALLDRPLAEALDGLPLAPELTRAILAGEGMLGAALQCALAYERGNWADVRFATLDAPAIGELYADAVVWTRATMRGL